MCGIVSAIAQRPIAEILQTGLHALEYRGYDSAGVCFMNSPKDSPEFQVQYLVFKQSGKVSALDKLLKDNQANGHIGIAHTRWATHGKPSTANAHPHVCGRIALVHNGIIENYSELKAQLLEQGQEFKSQTDTEVVAVLLNSLLMQGLSTLEAFRQTIAKLQGTFAFAMLDLQDKDHIYLAKRGSPLVIGLGIGENFAASDIIALLPVTSRFIYLEDGDIARLSLHKVEIWNQDLAVVERIEQQISVNPESLTKGKFKHYMQKEIFEQPEALEHTLIGRLGALDVTEQAFLPNPYYERQTTQGQDSEYSLADNSSENNSAISFRQCLKDIEHIEIVACGTSFHAGLVGKYFLEEYAQISTNVTIASEYRYKRTIVPPKSLFITLSQSGETADTLAALKLAKNQGYAHTLCICNVANSSIVRESEFVFLTMAGAEIGVASTKAFTTQLIALDLLTLATGRAHGTIDDVMALSIVRALNEVASQVRCALVQDSAIEHMSAEFAGKQHALFLGRGPMYPIALEGALKLKEISYIHAEGYASGELKHGPIALIDSNMPVVVVAPDNQWLPKLVSNIEEVKARGGRLYVFAGSNMSHENLSESFKVMEIKGIDPFVEPIVFTVPLQLLAYHVAVINGTDVDQPRNLAKSVTVE